MIDTQAIRNKVLNLAMRGQLTEQLPEDGTAEELYDQITKEKARLVNEKKIKKTKSIGDVPNDDTPFELPENWKWVYFGEIFSHNTGKALNSSNKEGNLLEYITTSNMYWDHFELDNLKKMYFKDEEIEKCTIRKGDLLICEGGDIGRSAIWPFSYEMRIQNHIHKLRPYLSTLLPVFYYYVMRLYKSINMISGQGIGLQGFSSKRVHSLVVPLPPVAEQTRIVEKIEAIFEILDKIDALQEQYVLNQEALKSKLIDAAIQGQLTEQLPEDGTAEELYRHIQEKKKALIKSKRFKKDKTKLEVNKEDVLFDIPSNWKWVCWGEIVNIVSARRVHQSDWRKEGIPFYRAREIAKLADEGFVDNDLYISEELYDEFSKSGVPSEGDLMVSAVGTLGKTYVVKESDHFYYKDASVLCFENYAAVDPYYLRYVMNSDAMKKQIESNSGGTTVDTLTMIRMIKYVLPLPPLAEQHRIVEKLDALLSLVE